MENPSRRVFIQGSLATGALALVPSSMACSQGNDDGVVVVPEWQEIGDGLESSNQCCWTAASPATGDDAGSPETHLPIVAVNGSGECAVSLAMPHPMTTEHWITTMYVRNQDGVVIGFRDFGQTALKPQFSRGTVPGLTFQVPPGTTRVRAFSYCNLHDHWASESNEV